MVLSTVLAAASCACILLTNPRRCFEHFLTFLGQPMSQAHLSLSGPAPRTCQVSEEPGEQCLGVPVAPGSSQQTGRAVCVSRHTLTRALASPRWTVSPELTLDLPAPSLPRRHSSVPPASFSDGEEPGPGALGMSSSFAGIPTWSQSQLCGAWVPARPASKPPDAPSAGRPPAWPQPQSPTGLATSQGRQGGEANRWVCCKEKTRREGVALAGL